MVQDRGRLDEPSREKLVNSLIGEGRYRQIKAWAETMLESASEPTPADHTIFAQVVAWKGLLRLSVAIDVGGAARRLLPPCPAFP